LVLSFSKNACILLLCVLTSMILSSFLLDESILEAARHLSHHRHQKGVLSSGWNARTSLGLPCASHSGSAQRAHSQASSV